MGSLLDTWVASHLRAEAQRSAHRYRLYHLRTAQGRHEIDFIAEIAGRGIVAVEVKATGAVSQRDIRHLTWLRDELDDLFVAGVVLNSGPYAHTMSDRIIAAPFSTLWCGPSPDGGFSETPGKRRTMIRQHSDPSPDLT